MAEQNKGGKKPKKLTLNKESVKALQDRDLEEVAGGLAEEQCPPGTEGLCTSTSKEKCDTTICGIKGK